MPQIVNNTTQNSIIDIVCPHYCKGCGALGSVLCWRCKKYILSKSSLEKYEKMPNIFMLGARKGLLGKMVSMYKYESMRGLADALAEMLAEVVPEIGEVVVVPLPTISRHIRERGFDHTVVLAKKLARMRGWKVRKMLVRMNNAVQVGVGAEERLKQAESAYGIRSVVDASLAYLLLDDVWTTGASMKAAERVLKAAGAKKVYKAVVAKS